MLAIQSSPLLHTQNPLAPVSTVVFVSAILAQFIPIIMVQVLVVEFHWYPLIQVQAPLTLDVLSVFAICVQSGTQLKLDPAHISPVAQLHEV